MPELGDDETPLEAVDAFYKYWSKFESWRDFPLAKGAQEHDVDSADSREEKRWMMQQNEAIQKRARKKEYKRLQKLVENAQGLAPRLARMRVAERVAKARAKEERAAALGARARRAAAGGLRQPPAAGRRRGPRPRRPILTRRRPTLSRWRPGPRRRRRRTRIPRRLV